MSVEPTTADKYKPCRAVSLLNEFREIIFPRRAGSRRNRDAYEFLRRVYETCGWAYRKFL